MNSKTSIIFLSKFQAFAKQTLINTKVLLLLLSHISRVRLYVTP